VLYLDEQGRVQTVHWCMTADGDDAPADVQPVGRTGEFDNATETLPEMLAELVDRFARATAASAAKAIKRKQKAVPAGNFREPTVLLGALDKAAARLEILTAVKKYAGHRQAVYWFDAGNGESQGQIAWGNTTDEKRVRQGSGKPLVEYLPYPPLVFPETTVPAKDQDESAPACIEAAQAGRQGLNINALMGLLLVEMLRQFLERRLRVHYVAVDLADFTTAPQTITDQSLETCA
jgi:hypothetical protein